MGPCGRNVPGRRNSHGRGLEEEVFLVQLRSSRKPVWWEQSERGGAWEEIPEKWEGGRWCWGPPGPCGDSSTLSEAEPPEGSEQGET